MNNQVVFRVVPHPNVTGYNGVWSTNGTGSTIIARNDVYAFVPSLTKISGSHTLKFGAEIRRNTHNYYQQNSPSGNFNFDRFMTAANFDRRWRRRFRVVPPRLWQRQAASIRTRWWPDS